MSTLSRKRLMTLVMALALALAAGACADSGTTGGGDNGSGSTCVADCDNKMCGDDGCGGVCGDFGGECADGSFCDLASQCVSEDACTDECPGTGAGYCGVVCGVPCGTCAGDELCQDFMCVAPAPVDNPDTPTECIGSGGALSTSCNPQIEVQWGNVPVTNGSTVNFALGGAEVGVPLEIGFIRITNTGNAALTLEELSISSVPDGLFTLSAASAETGLPVGGSPVMVQPTGTAEGTTTFGAVVTLTLDAEDTSPTGLITVRSDSKLNDSELLTFSLSAEGAEPQIQVTPSTVEFGNVSEGSSDTKAISILNTGTGDLVVTGFVLSGNEAFGFLLGANDWPVSEETESQGVTFDEPLVIPAGTATSTSIRFTPIGAEPAEATLILYSNDPNAQSGTVVPISGNLTGPCISINPKKVDFGGKLIGVQARVEVEILSCGEGPLTISGLSIVDLQEGEPSSSDFSLDLSEFVDEDSGAAIPILGENDAPVVIPVNQTRTFDVTFTPDMINPVNPEAGQDGHDASLPAGTPIPDLGKIRIVSDAFASELDVEVRGFGVEVECPTAVIVVQEGEEVIPQTKLHLIGSQSYAAGGSISKYEWSVQQPVGSQSVFLPSSSAPDPTFEVNVAGSYVFQLRVWDQNNEESCVPAEYTVFVNPDEAIHVELLWHTPLDPDETDEGPEAGADLDLHFLHPFATGEDVDGDGAPDGWFDQPFDCFWFNAHPNWGSLDPAKDDDPGLDLDDTDGAGPENVNLNQPQDGMTYKVGVHYWNDHDFGPSLATVRVYIYSSLVFQLSDVELVNHDMWEVADIAWPSGEVTLKTDLGGSYKITSEYNHPFFPTPD